VYTCIYSTNERIGENVWSMIVDGDAAKRHNDNLDSVDAMLEDIGLSRYHGPHESPTQHRNPKVAAAPSEKRCLGVTTN